MSASKESPVPSAITKIDEAVHAIVEARELNREAQANHIEGLPKWRTHEAIDDKLHDALAALGQ